MIVAFALASCASQSFESSESSVVSIQGSGLEKDIIREMNKTRQKFGKAPVTYNEGLASLAKEHSVFLSNNKGKLSGKSENISHDGFKSRFSRAKLNHNVSSLGENIAYMLVTGNVAKETIDAWYLSPSHKKTMLYRFYETAGVGVFKKGDRYYITMLMAELNSF